MIKKFPKLAILNMFNKLKKWEVVKTKEKNKPQKIKLRPASYQLLYSSRAAFAAAAAARAGTQGCLQGVTGWMQPSVLGLDSTQGHNCQTFQFHWKQPAYAHLVLCKWEEPCLLSLSIRPELSVLNIYIHTHKYIYIYLTSIQSHLLVCP